MKITSVKFVKGVVREDAIFSDRIPQIAFIGRSNVGKSSLINALTNSSISKTSSFPGRTQEINVFLINESVYFIDLPGYGFTRVAGAGKQKIATLIDTYLFHPDTNQRKIVLIIDANTGMTDQDKSMFDELENHGKDFIIALSKIDRMNQSDFHHRLIEVQQFAGDHSVFPCSSKSKRGIDAIIDCILSD